jgi:hypothetical protein
MATLYSVDPPEPNYARQCSPADDDRMDRIKLKESQSAFRNNSWMAVIALPAATAQIFLLPIDPCSLCVNYSMS